MTANPALMLISMLGATGTDDASSWSQLSAQDWSRLSRLAVTERVLANLGRRFIDLGYPEPPFVLARARSQRTGPLPPADLATSRYVLNRARNADLADQLQSVTAALAEERIDAVALKGAARLQTESELVRELTDLDLLVLDPAELERAHKVLLRIGYRDATDAEYQPQTLFPDDHQLRPLLLEGRSGSVELHRRPLESEYDRLLPLDAVVQSHAEAEQPDLLPPLVLALHSIIHSRIVDNSYRRHELALRSVLDLIELTDQDPALIDRLRERAQIAPPELRRAIEAHLYVAAKLDPTLSLGRLRPQIRLWWRWTLLLHRVPRIHRHWRTAALLPFGLRSERMDQRAGKKLSWPELQAWRLRYILKRSQSYLRSGQEQRHV